MLLPGCASGEAAVPMWDGVPSRHHEPYAADTGLVLQGDHLSATTGSGGQACYGTHRCSPRSDGKEAPALRHLRRTAARTVPTEDLRGHPVRSLRGGDAVRESARPLPQGGRRVAHQGVSDAGASAVHSFVKPVRRPYYRLLALVACWLSRSARTP